MNNIKDDIQNAITFIDEMATHALGPELKALYKVKLHLKALQTPEPGFQNATIYTADELQKLFIRNCCEGYFDECALINQGNMKEWFEWLASLKIIKEHGHGIL